MSNYPCLCVRVYGCPFVRVSVCVLSSEMKIFLKESYTSSDYSYYSKYMNNVIIFYSIFCNLYRNNHSCKGIRPSATEVSLSFWLFLVQLDKCTLKGRVSGVLVNKCFDLRAKRLASYYNNNHNGQHIPPSRMCVPAN